MYWWGRFERWQFNYNPVWLDLGTTNCRTNSTSKSCKDCPDNVIQNNEIQLQCHFILSSTLGSQRRKNWTNTSYSALLESVWERNWGQIVLLSLLTSMVESGTSQDCVSPLKGYELRFSLFEQSPWTQVYRYKYWDDTVFPGLPHVIKCPSVAHSIFQLRQGWAVQLHWGFPLLIRWGLLCWMQFVTKCIPKMPIVKTI